jgi:hypothetical protein
MTWDKKVVIQYSKNIFCYFLWYLQKFIFAWNWEWPVSIDSFYWIMDVNLLWILISIIVANPLHWYVTKSQKWIQKKNEVWNERAQFFIAEELTN